MAESTRTMLGTVAIVTLLWLAYLAWLVSQRVPPPPVGSTRLVLDTGSDEVNTPSVVIHPVPGFNFSLRNMKCTYHACFDIDACRLVGEHRIGVYIYPRRRYYTPGGHRLFQFRSRQFDNLMRAIRDSPYYTEDPDRACVFLPDIDTLNPSNYELDWLPQYLYHLPKWSGNGVNHLLLEAYPVRVALVRPGPTIIRLPLSKAMVASASFTERTYRSTFDIALPTLAAGRPDDQTESFSDDSLDSTERPVLLASAPPSAPEPVKRLRRSLGDRRFLQLNFCPSASAATEESRCARNGTRYAYPDVLSKATFCLVFYTQLTGSAALLDAVSRQCIPVILTNTNVFPFHELIEWNRFSIRLNREADVGSLFRMLTKFSRQYVAFMRYQMRVIYKRYFASPAAVALAVLQILNDRVFPYMAPSMQESNGPQSVAGLPVSPSPPLFHTAPLNSNQGYTAVVLTRGGSFSKLIRTLASLVTSGATGSASPRPPHLRKILIVWNGLTEAPPPLLGGHWPAMPPGVGLEIVQTGDDRLTNRFFPYDQIETDAVLSLLDDDVDVLVPSEVLLAYHVWLENPDSLVGLGADSSSGGQQPSVSPFLAGAAFYHKQYGALFHDTLPTELLDYIDSIGDCEHFAMNCMVANLTGRGAVKIGQPSLRSVAAGPGRDRTALAADCLSEIGRYLGGFGLESSRRVWIAFKADPVLYGTAYANWTANAGFLGFNSVT
uniref:Exostosin domain-containing protein n=1 Tax=Macrostomum lignano TaxID=282301 RepID=A0A1I8IDU4_9PLAT